MVYAGTKNVTTTGTPVPLAAQRTAACWVKIQAKLNNTGLINVIGCGIKDPTNPASTIDTTGGIEITGGGVLELGNESAATNYYDLNKIYIDAGTSGEGVKFLYGRR